MTHCSLLYSSLISYSVKFHSLSTIIHTAHEALPRYSTTSPSLSNRSIRYFPRIYRPFAAAAAAAAMEVGQAQDGAASGSTPSMKLLFVEMGVGYDQHGQDITVAAMRACRDAISSNSIPAFRRGSIPGVTSAQMKLEIKLGVPHCLQQSLDIEKVKSVFPYGDIVKVEIVDGGLICSSGTHIEEMGDKNDDCYIVNAAIYVGY